MQMIIWIINYYKNWFSVIFHCCKTVGILFINHLFRSFSVLLEYRRLLDWLFLRIFDLFPGSVLIFLRDVAWLWIVLLLLSLIGFRLFIVSLFVVLFWLIFTLLIALVMLVLLPLCLLFSCLLCPILGFFLFGVFFPYFWHVFPFLTIFSVMLLLVFLMLWSFLFFFRFFLVYHFSQVLVGIVRNFGHLSMPFFFLFIRKMRFCTFPEV